MIKSNDMYDAFNHIIPGYAFIDFQQGVAFDAGLVPRVAFNNFFINVPPTDATLIGKIIKEQHDKLAKKLLTESQLLLYVYNEERQALERFDPDKEIKIEQYKNKLLTMSNIAALNKTNET